MTHPSVQGGAGILRPNSQKKIRIFAAEGQFSEKDKAEVSLFADSSHLNLKSHIKANQDELKDLLKTLTPTTSVVMQFQLKDCPKPKLKLAHPCDTCGKAFAYMEALTTHKKKEHKILVPHVFQCAYCDYKGAKTLKTHRAHEQRHVRPTLKKAPQHQCELCEKRCFGEKQLALHVEKRHTEHLCRLACGEKFINKAEERRHWLNKHARQQSDKALEVPPPCQICGKKYSWKSGLQKHLRESRCGEILTEQHYDEDGQKDKGVDGEKEVDGGEKEVDGDQNLNEVVGGEKDKEAVDLQTDDHKEAGRSEAKRKEAPSRTRGKKMKVPDENRAESEYEKIREAVNHPIG